MLAMERLDLYSESHWRRGDKDSDVPIASSQYKPSKSDINGMHLRDDVTNAFWNNEEYNCKAHFGVENFSSRYKNNGDYPLEEISQDVMYHNIEGLSLVARLVGTENVTNIPVTFKMNIIPQYLAEKGIKNGNNVDFSLWAKDIIRRYIAYFQSNTEPVEDDTFSFGKIKFTLNNYWYLNNPVTGNNVKEGSGLEDFPDAYYFYNYGLIAVGKEIVGEDLREEKGFVASERLFKSILQSGMDHTAATVSTGMRNYIKDALMEIICPSSANDTKFKKWFKIIVTGGAYAIPYEAASYISDCVIDKLDERLTKLDSINNDDYKVRSLSCTGLVLGDNTYKTLVNRRSYDPRKTGEPLIYEHFPLMCLVLHDRENCKNMKYGNSDYASEKAIYEKLLNSAPLCGPSGDCRFTADYYSHNWSETSRCVWPEKLRPGKINKQCEDIEFNGMDYMMLYNLYCIAFSREQYVSKVAGNKSVSEGVYALKCNIPITSQNITHSAPSITYGPGFSVSGNNFTAKATSLPSDAVKGTQYKPLDVDCGCKEYELDPKISCVSATWKCNSIVEVALDNAPSNANIIWTSSNNLNKCYHTDKKAFFQVKGPGRASIEASFTDNGIKYTARFTYNIPGLATPVINKPNSGTYDGIYTPGQQYLFSVNNVSDATSYDWQFTRAGIYSWPNGENGNTVNIIINSQPSSQSNICEFEIKVAAKNSCETGNYTTYTGSVYRTSSRMAHITDTVATDNNLLLLSVDELNMESQESLFIVYPNPATTELNITQTVSSNALSLKKDATIKTVDIFDVKGDKCASHVFNDAQTTATIDITDLANGIFVIVINKDSDDSQTCTFVKK